VLLLAFGLLPIAAASVVGYAVSRSTIMAQAQEALEGVAKGWSVHFASELDREQLVLRTIVGQLPDARVLLKASSQQLSSLLVLGLPTNGVFDGLRLVTDDGRVLASVALLATAPHWPAQAPAAEWQLPTQVVHRDEGRVLAYLVGTTVSDNPAIWLEGHVREADFRRVYSVPEHLLDGVEAVVFERDGQPVFGTHQHAVDELRSLVTTLDLGREATQLTRTQPAALIRVVPMPGSDWSLVAILPVAHALAPLGRLRTAALVGAGVLGLAILLTSVVASRSVARPLGSLAEAARHLGEEERAPPVHLPAGSTHEVGSLITAFNTMAANLDRSRRELAELHLRDMERAQQLATVGELASGVAHEIRNPLTGVRGAIELALRHIPEQDASRDLLTEAQHQLARIEGTTAQLLRYARPPALKEVTVDANLLVERAATLVAPQAATARVELQIELCPRPLMVRVDSELLVQVLVNLLLNGIEAMSPGGLLTAWVAAHAPEAWIGVHDTGPGVAPAHGQEIFRPFFSTKHQGTGLGLSISRDIVTRHGGTLRLESDHGKGATFVVALPLAEVD